MRSHGNARNRRASIKYSSLRAMLARRSSPRSATSTSPPTTSRPCSNSPCAKTSNSPSSARKDRWSPASSTDSPRPAVACFGPSAAAARLEGSKAFTKDFLRRHRIPTASYAAFTAANFDPAYIRAQRLPLVVKADGLAAGKGVIICESHDAAIDAANAMLGGSFGAAGNTIVIEEFLAGEEVSFIVIASDQTVVPLATSQDHKRRDDGDRGPNTGGMGAYSPAPIVTPALHARIMREVIEPTLRGLRADGNPYLGFLYAGLMIAADGTPNVLEFNCRFGDPETQPILMRLQSDLSTCAKRRSPARCTEARARWDPRAALGVVMAAGGYPDQYRKGDPISGLDAAAKLPGKVFHAGTRVEGDRSSPPAAACCAPWAWATPSPARKRRPTILCMPFTGTLCNIAATSAIAPSREPMASRFETVHNYNDEAVFRAINESASQYPLLAGDPELLADVACVALNRLPPRYVRHDLDTNFYMSDDARARFDAAVKTAVSFAFDFVQSRSTFKSA